MRQNVNATTVNALVAVTLAASAPAPEPYPVYAVDEDGNELIDEPPVRRVPMRRRLTVPRGLLGAYDIATRSRTRRPSRRTPRQTPRTSSRGTTGRRLNPGAKYLKRETRNDNLRPHGAATALGTPCCGTRARRAPAGLAALPLTREMYPGDAERDAAVLLARATHDGKAQTARLREREKKLGLGKRRDLTEKKRKRGGSGRGRGSGSGRGNGRAGRSKVRDGEVSSTNTRTRRRFATRRRSTRRLRRRLSVGGENRSRRRMRRRTRKRLSSAWAARARDTRRDRACRPTRASRERARGSSGRRA